MRLCKKIKTPKWNSMLEYNCALFFLFKDALQELENLGDTEELKHLRRFLLLSQMSGRRGLIPGKGKKSVSDEE